MTKQKSKNRALLMSALGLFVCVSMLVGSTFAWFSDDITSASNKIKAGTLQIALEYSEDDGVTWHDAENETLKFIAADGRQDILWEPGCTYNLPLIRVRNNGSLALKYEITIDGATGDQELLDAIKFTANGNAFRTFSGTLLETDAVSESIQITGHMKETAGNECQGKSIDGISITVNATQFTYEQDSLDEDYDEDATYQ